MSTWSNRPADKTKEDGRNRLIQTLCAGEPPFKLDGN